MFHPAVPDIAAAEQWIREDTGRAPRLTEAALRRIEALEPAVRAFLHLDADGARRRAAEPTYGPLAGIPVAVKDVVDVMGMPTTGGSRAYRWIPDVDAPAVARLRAAGAVLLGKTNTQELAFGVETPPTRNPWDLARIPGGSSGGSAAALAAGMCLGAVGSDTGGSVRIPAACCGVVGFKPTVGRIPTAGVMPLSYTCDHVGALGHSVFDVTRLYQIMADRPVTVAPPIGGIRHRRLAVPWSFWEPWASPAVRRAFQTALQLFSDLGFDVVDIAMEPWEEWLDLQLTLRLPEAYSFHRPVLEGPRRALLGGDLAARLDPGRDVPATRYVEAQRRRLALMQAWQERMAGRDAVVMPTIPVTAPPVGTSHVTLGGRTVTVWEALIALTAAWNVIGWPAISVPGPLADDGLPTGVQIIGPSGADDAVLELAALFERIRGPLPAPALPEVPDPLALGRDVS
jgi:aspartyl-tRNA(Asn)/glutamyl-tRNA(Gln) amidotransferase subunit A